MTDSVVKCEKCGYEERVSFGTCLRSGWPTCCGGYTMSLITKPTQETVDAAVRTIIAELEQP